MSEKEQKNNSGNSRKWIVKKGRMKPETRVRDLTVPREGDKTNILFYVSLKRKQDLAVKLKYDSLNRSEFLRVMIDGYLDNDPDVMAYIEKYKETMEVHNTAKRDKTKRLRKKAQETKKNFALTDNDISSIFDIIAEENPDL